MVLIMRRNVHLFTKKKGVQQTATVKDHLLYMSNCEVSAAQLEQCVVPVGTEYKSNHYMQECKFQLKFSPCLMEYS